MIPHSLFPSPKNLGSCSWWVHVGRWQAMNDKQEYAVCYNYEKSNSISERLVRLDQVRLHEFENLDISCLENQQQQQQLKVHECILGTPGESIYYNGMFAVLHLYNSQLQMNHKVLVQADHFLLHTMAKKLGQHPPQCITVQPASTPPNHVSPKCMVLLQIPFTDSLPPLQTLNSELYYFL